MRGDQEGFVEDAISADGRGHFLSSYDGGEFESCIKVNETLEVSSEHPTFVHVNHVVYIYRIKSFESHTKSHPPG